MGLLDSLMGGQNSGMLGQLASTLGLEPNKMQGLLGQLVPALGSGFINQAQQNGPSGLMGLLQNGDHAQYAQAPERLAEPAATDTGNNILSQIFGSKDVSRQVAQTTAQHTGIGAEIIKKALPLVAIMAASALGDKLQHGFHAADNNANPMGTVPNADGNGMLGQLSQFFGHNTASNSQPSIINQVMSLLGNQQSAA